MIRRPLSLLLTLLLAATLVACGGGEDSSDQKSAGIDQVTIEGDPGEQPKVDFGGKLDVSSLDSEVVSEGDGEEVADGDQVLAQIWLGNGFTQQKAFSTYDADQPQLLTVDNKQLSELFLTGLEGHKVGSRVAVAAPASTAFGPQGNPQIGIGNQDSVLTVIDLLAMVPDGPDGTKQKAPGWSPALKGASEAPTGLSFSGTPQPDGTLKDAVLIKGAGEKVSKGQTIVVNYLGQVYGSQKPFDESYSKQPTSFPIGVGAVVKGWDQALVGQTVGSRVMLAIPPKLGYGPKGNKQAGIKGTDTLYFVVDILAAA